MGYRLSGFELVGHGGTTSSQATWRPDGILSAVYLVLQTSLQAMQKGLGMRQSDSSRISTEAARLLVKAELNASATTETSPSTNVVGLSRCGAERVARQQCSSGASWFLASTHQAQLAG